MRSMSRLPSLFVYSVSAFSTNILVRSQGLNTTFLLRGFILSRPETKCIFQEGYIPVLCRALNSVLHLVRCSSLSKSILQFTLLSSSLISENKVIKNAELFMIANLAQPSTSWTRLSQWFSYKIVSELLMLALRDGLQAKHHAKQVSSSSIRHSVSMGSKAANEVVCSHIFNIMDVYKYPDTW